MQNASDIFQSHPELLAKRELTIFALLMDRSGSMNQQGDTPRTAINRHISDLKSHPNADNAIGFVMTFADDSRMDITPQPLRGMPLMADYRPNGNTLLYGTVLRALQELLELKARAESHGTSVNLILSVFTDGQDNPPKSEKSTDFQTPLKALTARALEAQTQLILVGIGCRAACIAKDMGFPPKDVVNIAGTAEAVSRTMTYVTRRTHITMMGCTPTTAPDPPPSSR